MNTTLANKIYNISHLKGEFQLRSGQISDEYFDKYLFESNPQILSEIARSLSEIIPKNTEILAGLEMGGIPIATAISLNTQIPVIFVRKQAKEYGTCKIAEGMNFKNKKVCIIEDVITTGGAVVDGVKELRKQGTIVDNVICVIERSTKGRGNLNAIDLELLSLFTMEQLSSSAK